jgi:hypothetical protein
MAMGTLSGLLTAGLRDAGFRRAAATAALAAISLVARVAAADHPGALREAELSHVTIALLSAGLALATGLVVLIIVMLLTRKGAGAEKSDE